MKNTIEFAQKELNELSNSNPTEAWDVRKEKQRLLVLAGILLGVLSNIGNANTTVIIND